MIAMFVDDKFIRPYVGDYNVVILMYCFVRCFFTFSMKQVAISVLLFSYSIEILQYFDFVHRLGLTNSKLANLILGNHFEWIDVIAYNLGILTVVVIERFIGHGEILGTLKNNVE